MFWVISVYFNIRNTLLKFCPFLLGHPVVIFRDVTSCSSVYRYHVLKEPAASMFKVEGFFYSEVGGGRFLPNVVQGC